VGTLVRALPRRHIEFHSSPELVLLVLALCEGFRSQFCCVFVSVPTMSAEQFVSRPANLDAVNFRHDWNSFAGWSATMVLPGLQTHQSMLGCFDCPTQISESGTICEQSMVADNKKPKRHPLSRLTSHSTAVMCASRQPFAPRSCTTSPAFTRKSGLVGATGTTTQPRPGTVNALSSFARKTITNLSLRLCPLGHESEVDPKKSAVPGELPANRQMSTDLAETFLADPLTS
jgi:hypothetical protein